MKKSKIFPVLLVFITLSASLAFGEETEKPFKWKSFTLTFKGDYMSISDPDYEDLYGEKKYFPEGEIEIRISGNIYIWGSYGLINGNGEWSEWSNKSLAEPDYRWDIASTRQQFSFGAGYSIGLNEPGEFTIKFQLGICVVDHREVSEKFLISNEELETSTEVSSQKIGGIGELGVTYTLWKSVFAEVSLGYIYATKTTIGEDDTEENTEIGGLKISLGVGFRF